MSEQEKTEKVREFPKGIVTGAILGYLVFIIYLYVAYPPLK